MTRIATALLVPLLFGPLAGAQESDPPAAAAPQDPAEYRAARQAVARSLANLAGSGGYRFTAKVSFPDREKEEDPNPANRRAMVIGLGGIGGGPKAGAEVRGSVFPDGLLLFTLDGTDRGAARQGGGMLFLRDDEGRWRPRLARNLAGRRLWWRPDPTFLLTEAARLLGPEKGAEGVELSRGGLTRVGLRHLREYRLTLAGEPARDLLAAGLLPNPTWAPTGGTGRVVISSLMGRAAPEDLEYRFSIWVDARTRTIHKVSILSSGKPGANAAGGRVVFRMGRGGKMIQGDQDEDEPKRVQVDLEITSQGIPAWRERSRGIEQRLGLEHLEPPADTREESGEKEKEEAGSL